MDMMQDPITTHIYMVYAFLVIMLLNLYSVLTVKDFMTLAKRLKFMTPLYHVTNAVVIYTGAIVAAFRQTFTIDMAIMIVASILLMVLEIKRYKKQRVIKSSDITLQEQFYSYAKKIYIAEIIVLIATYFIIKII